MFLLRSEFLRLVIFDMIRSEELDHVVARHSGRSSTRIPSSLWTLAKLSWTTCQLDSAHLYTTYRRRETSNVPPTNRISPQSRCTAQLEWVLDSLQTDGDLPPNPSALVQALRSVISMLEAHSRVEEGKDHQDVGEVAQLHEPEKIDETKEEGVPSEQVERELEDYQVCA